MKLHKKLIAILATVLCLMLITACGGTKKDETDSSKKSKEITLTDAMGEVTLPANPERILASNLEDSLVSLDIIPAAQWSIGESVHAYLQDALGNVPTIAWDMPLEQVIEKDPDLIIFSSPSAIPSGTYEEYKKIAPVYVFKDEDSSDWRKQLQIMGQIVGKEKQAKEELAAYETIAKDASEKLKKAIGDESVAAIWIIGGQYYLLENERFSANVLYKDLQLTQPNMIKNMPAAKDATWSPISLEALSDLDADHVFLIAAKGEAGLQALTNSTVWKQLPAAKNKQVYELEDDGSWTINGRIASEKVIDTVTKTLVK